MIDDDFVLDLRQPKHARKAKQQCPRRSHTVELKQVFGNPLGHPRIVELQLDPKTLIQHLKERSLLRTKSEERRLSAFLRRGVCYGSGSVDSIECSDLRVLSWIIKFCLDSNIDTENIANPYDVVDEEDMPAEKIDNPYKEWMLLLVHEWIQKSSLSPDVLPFLSVVLCTLVHELCIYRYYASYLKAVTNKSQHRLTHQAYNDLFVEGILFWTGYRFQWDINYDRFEYIGIIVSDGFTSHQNDFENVVMYALRHTTETTWMKCHMYPNNTEVHTSTINAWCIKLGVTSFLHEGVRSICFPSDGSGLRLDGTLRCWQTIPCFRLQLSDLFPHVPHKAKTTMTPVAFQDTRVQRAADHRLAVGVVLRSYLLSDIARLCIVYITFL
jgi:hypothetical protein